MLAKILIADDDLEILELLKFTFESEGYVVITANDGKEALQFAKDEHPDLVILDVNMPKLSGFEVCEKIRQNSATCLLPIIMLTSYTKIKDKVTGIKLGADDYISKPFEPFELLARVEGLVKRTRESLSANPLTHLPGNISIETEIKKRLEKNDSFAVIYADIDNFKSFNDKYGFEKGDNIIKFSAMIIRAAVTAMGNKNDFIGHIGGEDFVIVTTLDKLEEITSTIIKYFDEMIPQQYDEDVRSRGYMWGLNRQGEEVKFSLMTISIGICVVEKNKYSHYSQIVDQAKDMLKKAKAQEGSTFMQG